MANCDACGEKMDMMDDDSFYCPYCGETSSPLFEDPDYYEDEQ